MVGAASQAYTGVMPLISDGIGMFMRYNFGEEEEEEADVEEK